jgi:hypothetical protein
VVLTVRVSVGKQRQKQEYYGDNAKELLVKWDYILKSLVIYI